MKGANSVLSKRSFPGKERRSPGPGVPNALPCGESLFIFLNEDKDLWEFATGIADEPVRVWRLKGNALSDLTREGWKIEGPFSGLCPELCPRQLDRNQAQPPQSNFVPARDAASPELSNVCRGISQG